MRGTIVGLQHDSALMSLAASGQEHQEPKASRLVAELNTLNESEVGLLERRRLRLKDASYAFGICLASPTSRESVA